MTTNDQSRTPEMQAAKRVAKKIGGLLWNHRGPFGVNNHADRPRPGCPSCVFSGAFEVEGE
jgi:hypothetical protein